jgi:hypothetical protein
MELFVVDLSTIFVVLAQSSQPCPITKLSRAASTTSGDVEILWL